MCKRSTPDPLVRTFLDKYGVNLLRVPREGADVGEVYVQDDRSVSAPGHIRHLLAPAPRLPPVQSDELLADLSGTVSEAVSTRIGLGFLEGFFSALGAPAVISSLSPSWESKRDLGMRFAFRSATRDSVDPIHLGAKLIGTKLRDDHPFVAEGRKYFVVTAVIRSRSISLIFNSDQTSSGKLIAEAAKVVEATGSVEVEHKSESEITFRGRRRLAIGVELHELRYDQKRGQLMFATAGAIAVAGHKAAPLVTPSWIDTPNDEVLVDLPETQRAGDPASEVATGS